MLKKPTHCRNNVGSARKAHPIEIFEIGDALQATVEGDFMGLKKNRLKKATLPHPNLGSIDLAASRRGAMDACGPRGWYQWSLEFVFRSCPLSALLMQTWLLSVIQHVQVAEP